MKTLLIIVALTIAGCSDNPAAPKPCDEACKKIVRKQTLTVTHGIHPSTRYILVAKDSTYITVAKPTYDAVCPPERYCAGECAWRPLR